MTSSRAGSAGPARARKEAEDIWPLANASDDPEDVSVIGHPGEDWYVQLLRDGYMTVTCRLHDGYMAIPARTGTWPTWPAAARHPTIRYPPLTEPDTPPRHPLPPARVRVCYTRPSSVRIDLISSHPSNLRLEPPPPLRRACLRGRGSGVSPCGYNARYRLTPP